MSEMLSYVNILNDIQNFKKSGTKHGSDFNIYDTPTNKYFKILFYFGDTTPNANENGLSNGLLHPTWEIFNNREDAAFSTGMDKLNYYDFNSAWSFLKMNDENERAEKLERFVTLLSDINMFSPWYFTSIGGLSEALERKGIDDGKIDMSENKKITISCLPDAFDNRIGTLLELYRDVTWSWVHKRQVIPSNLRKFDMAVYIFETPNKRWHESKKSIPNIPGNDEEITIGKNTGGFMVSYKMIEFHDCEIDYNSIKSGWSEMSNETGVQPKYNIDISYADCYEISYNDIMMRKIGDVILTDLFNANESVKQEDSTIQVNEIQQRTDMENIRSLQDVEHQFKNKKSVIEHLGNLSNRYGAQSSEMNLQTKKVYNQGFISNAIGQVVGTAVSDVKNLFKRAVLGNIYGHSLTDIGSTIDGALQGNLIPTIQKAGVNTNKPAMQGGQSIKNFMKNLHTSKPKNTYIQPKGNIFSPSTIANN